MKRAALALLVLLVALLAPAHDAHAGNFPFAFWEPSGPPPFNPATLSLDWWQTPDYPGTGVAWPGTASAGTSGSHSNNSSGAIAGTTVNGHVSILLAGGASSISADTLDKYITTTQFSGAIVFDSTAAPADQGPGLRVLNAQLASVSSGNFFGVQFSSSGVGFWMLSSFVGYVDNAIACSLNVWHAFQFKYNGSVMKSRLDGAAWQTSGAIASGFNGTSPSAVTYRFGTPSFAAANPTADVEEGFLSKALLSDTDFDNYLGAMRTKYAQPF